MIRPDHKQAGKETSAFSVSVELRPLSELPEDLSSVHEYWRSIIPEGCLGPSWRDFDMLQIPPRYLPTAVVVDYDPIKNAYRYRYWGRHLAGIFGRDLTNKTFEDCPGAFRDVSYETYGVVVRQKKPCLVRFHANVDQTETTIQTAFRMPLFDDGETVSGVVSLILLEYEKYKWNRLWE